MIISHGDDRSLFSWLVLQEKILRLWIEDVLAAAPSDTRFIEKLERHQRWLASQIEQLNKQRAA